MQKPKDWENVKASGDFIPLPAGGYICKIMEAREVTYPGNGEPFNKLEVSIDITEGEFKGHYADDYRTQQQEDKKWRGILRLYLPKDDGSEKDGWTQSTLKAFIEAVEESNPGFHWEWDESKLKDKKLGVLFREEEWSFNDRTGWKTQPFKGISVERIKAGKFKVPAKRPLKNTTSSQDAFTQVEETDDLPF